MLKTARLRGILTGNQRINSSVASNVITQMVETMRVRMTATMTRKSSGSLATEAPEATYSGPAVTTAITTDRGSAIFRTMREKRRMPGSFSRIARSSAYTIQMDNTQEANWVTSQAQR